MNAWFCYASCLISGSS